MSFGRFGAGSPTSGSARVKDTDESPVADVRTHPAVDPAVVFDYLTATWYLGLEFGYEKAALGTGSPTSNSARGEIPRTNLL